MEDIPADRNREAFNFALVTADRERIEKRLGWMFMGAVTRVDDRAINLFGEQMHGTRPRMPYHDDIGTHRVQRHRRVEQSLALFDARRRHGHVHDIGTEALAGKLEGRLRAGRGLEKQVDESPPAQGCTFFLDLAGYFHRSLGEIEENYDVLGGKPLDPEQVPVRK